MRRSLIDRLSAQRGDEGMSLVEAMMSMVLLGVISAILVLAMSSAVSSQKVGQDESDGLGDVRTVVEQLGRDVRSARAVTCDGGNTLDPTDTACQAHLQLWIDYNSDYREEDATESVTWQLIQAADGKHYEVIRTLDGESRVVARSLIVKVAFTYDAQPTALETSPTQQVKTTMTYDTLIGLGTNKRTVTFTERLRNVV